MERQVGFMIYGVMCVKTERDDWQRWSFTTIEGGNVAPEEVEAARGQLDEVHFGRNLKPVLKILLD